jgi:amidase
MYTMATKFRTSINSYLSKLTKNSNKLYKLKDLVNFTKEEPREEADKRDLNLWELALRSNYLSNEYKEARRRAEYWAGLSSISGALYRHHLNAIITPATAKMSNHFTAAGGLPSLIVPLGFMPKDTSVK